MERLHSLHPRAEYSMSPTFVITIHTKCTIKYNANAQVATAYWVRTVLQCGPNARNGRGLHGESPSRLGSVLVSGMFPALRLFGDPRCIIVPMVRLFLNVAALLIMNVLIAPYDCIRNPCIVLGGESSEPSAHARKSLCTQLVQQCRRGLRARACRGGGREYAEGERTRRRRAYSRCGVRWDGSCAHE